MKTHSKTSPRKTNFAEKSVCILTGKRNKGKRERTPFILEDAPVACYICEREGTRMLKKKASILENFRGKKKHIRVQATQCVFSTLWHGTRGCKYKPARCGQL